MTNAAITVDGGTKLLRTIIPPAAEYFLGKLLPGRIIRKLVLHVSLEEGMTVKGDCSWVDRRVRPRDFEVSIETEMHPYAILSTLAHECIHVAQYASGRLMDTKNLNVTIWDGKEYDLRVVDYFSLPWELEAYGRETGLLENYIVENSLRSKAWTRDPDYL